MWLSMLLDVWVVRRVILLMWIEVGRERMRRMRTVQCMKVKYSKRIGMVQCVWDSEKEAVFTRQPGCHMDTIHRRYPATAPRGDFCLLGFPPGPVRPSLDDLDNPSSDSSSISAPCLAWTPDQHEHPYARTPGPTKSRTLASKQLDYRRTPPRPAVNIDSTQSFHAHWTSYRQHNLQLSDNFNQQCPPQSTQHTSTSSHCKCIQD